MHQLKNGYTRIANSLMEYFYKTPLSGAGFRIIFWVFRNSYGYHRKKTRPISIRKLAEVLNMEGIGAVHLAVQVLLENGILIKSKDGEYELNKNQLLISVPKTEHLKAFPKLNGSVPKTERSVPKTERSVPKTEHPLIIRKDNLKDNLKETEIYPEFETFWGVYPKRTGKHKAREAWDKKRPPLQDCLKTLAWQIKSEQWTKDRGQFIPMPTTWINQGRWTDEPIKGNSNTGDRSAPIPGKYDGLGEKA